MTQKPESFKIHCLELGPMENFVYFIEDVATRQAAVVDPAWDVNTLLQYAARCGLKITDILLTHSHHDHINGIDGVLDAHDARVHLLKAETQLWHGYSAATLLHHGGDKIQLGSNTIEVLHTPGHTPGSACFHIGDHLIAGDTLFVFGCGRCDLAGGDPEQMFNTLKHIRDGLPAHTVLHPGHNYAEKPTSTLAEQIEGNPFLHFTDPASFTQYRMHEHDKVRDAPYGPVYKH